MQLNSLGEESLHDMQLTHSFTHSRQLGSSFLKLTFSEFKIFQVENWKKIGLVSKAQ